jgi:DNA repair exonuclease SbcCD ATPase subunit/DNA repair exonuclease SbcCD nuclease subunit
LKFAHIADTHIKNLKYHYEYNIIFEQLYETLRKEEVDYIIHCGDIAHTKTQISPEFVEMCSQFFKNLAEIAPTYIILGNHDGNLKNSSRQDALTPIIEALNLDDLHLLKDSGETHINDNFCLNVLSVFDRDNWTKPTNADKINIALYHGSISRCKTDTNWTMTHGEDELSIFDDFDFAMLGDIHRRQFLDEAGRVWYAGSTIQQNHGETNDKGILIWDIKSKDDWEIEPYVLENPKPFFTIPLTLTGRMPRNIEVPKNARLRLVSTNNLPLDSMRRAMDIAKHRFKPESISFLNRAAGQRGNVENITNTLQTENLRDINIQEELIDEYLKDFQVDSDTLEAVYELNRKYNKIVEDNEEISRNVNWKINNFKWDNLFNYGEDNAIGFHSMSGIIGIFGKNFSGKSSIIDAALYTLFNTTSKNERKNLNVINQNKQFGRGEVEIQVGTKRYTITRASEKYIRRLKGEETQEAKTDLNFEVYDEATGETTSLNGTTRNQTDANIRRHFGTIEDFSVSSLASQHGAFSFVDEGSTRRKEIIAKFLDLEVFDQKFKLAKEDSVETKVLLKKNENRDFDSEIDEVLVQLKKAKKSSTNNQSTCSRLKESIVATEAALASLNTQIESLPAEYINISEAITARDKKSKLLTITTDKIVVDNASIDAKVEKINRSNELLKSIDIDAIRERKIDADTLQATVARLKEDMENIDKKKRLLAGIPCGDSFPTCRFIKDAHAAVSSSDLVERDLKQAVDELAAMEVETIDRRLEQYTKITDLVRNLEVELNSLKLRRERNNTASTKLQFELREIQTKIEEYNQNKDVIENLEKLLKQRRGYEEEIKLSQTKIDNCEKKTLDLYKQVGSKEERLQLLRDEKLSHLRLRREFAAYDLFMRCMHANGIAYDIIKKKIPVINQEIAKILANIVDFEIFFESNGNKFDIFIKHPQYDERPIEMSSGAEKTMAAMAIRLALLSVSSLPKADLFILDEPGTALDEENMEGFIRILELIKVYFKNVLLISHLDSLKDCVDMQIVIEKIKGYARVNQ